MKIPVCSNENSERKFAKFAIPSTNGYAPSACWDIDYALAEDGGDWSRTLVYFPDAQKYIEQVQIPPPNQLVNQEEREALIKLKEFYTRHESAIELENGDSWMVDLFTGCIDTKSNPQSYFFTRKLHYQVYFDAFGWIMWFKKFFNRPRPYQVWPTDFYAAAPFFPGHPSYPSGHSSDSHIVANIYGLILSKQTIDYRETILKIQQRADEIARNREIASVHFPSDSAAGKVLADQIVNAFSRSANFQYLLNMARAEWVKTP